MRILLFTLALFALTVSAFAQDVTNPSQVEFDLSIDHALISSYEVDIVDSVGNVIATVPLGKPAGVAGDTVQVDILVQPIPFGHYTGAFRAVPTDPTFSSDDVPGDNEFDRKPGGPSRPRFAFYCYGFGCIAVPLTD